MSTARCLVVCRVSVIFFEDADLRASSARVAPNLLLGWRNHALGEILPCACLRMFFDKLFNQSIFQRVERDDRETPATLEQVHKLRQGSLQFPKFVVDDNPECLEDFRGRMDATTTRH